MNKNKINNKGFAAIMALLVVISLVLVISLSISIVVINENQIDKNLVLSAQSYYSAESGVEDGLLRIVDVNYNYNTGANNLNLDGSTIIQDIDQTGSSITIESASSYHNNEREVQVELVLSSTSVQFHYGVQVGDGGVEMDSTGSIIHGNLYSNGPVIEVADGDATVTENVIVAGANILDDITVGGNAYANSIIDSEITGNAYYTSISGTTVTGTEISPYSDSDMIDMPLSDDEINAFKTDAAAIATLDPALCTLSADTIIDGGKIICPSGFDMKNNDITLNGTLWVVGDATFKNTIFLGSGYGSNSGVIIVDGKIVIENGLKICGSAGCDVNNDTYIMLLSTYSGTEDGDYAADVRNTATGSIVYTPNGTTFLKNNAEAKEVIAKKLVTSNNTDVFYETGLANVNFTSGPSGGWVVNDWNEI